MEAWPSVASPLSCFVMQSREGIGSTTVCGEDRGHQRPLWTADKPETMSMLSGAALGTRSRRVHNQDEGGCVKCSVSCASATRDMCLGKGVSVSNRKISSLHIYTHIHIYPSSPLIRWLRRSHNYGHSSCGGLDRRVSFYRPGACCTIPRNPKPPAIHCVGRLQPPIAVYCIYAAPTWTQ